MEKSSFYFWYIARLFFLNPWLWPIQQILTRQGKSIIKGLGHKDSIELLRHEVFPLLYEDVLFPWDYDHLGLSYLLPLHYLKYKRKLKWKVGEHCLISFRIRTLFHYNWFLTTLSFRYNCQSNWISIDIHHTSTLCAQPTDEKK